MGTGFEFKCKNCNYKLSVNLGIGFRYPYLCNSILDDMKSGKMGKDFQEKANNIKNPAVYVPRDLYLCENCGDLRPELTIALCSPINDPRESDAPFSSVCECLEFDTYVMSYMLGTEYKKELVNEYHCKKCKTKMKKLTSYKKLKCPQCQNLLSYSKYFWD